MNIHGIKKKIQEYKLKLRNESLSKRRRSRYNKKLKGYKNMLNKKRREKK